MKFSGADLAKHKWKTIQTHNREHEESREHKDSKPKLEDLQAAHLRMIKALEEKDHVAVKESLHDFIENHFSEKKKKGLNTHEHDWYEFT